LCHLSRSLFVSRIERRCREVKVLQR
jgi:hypothetical protein